MHKFTMAALSAILASSVQVASADEWSGNMNLLLGQKNLKEDDWKSLDSQGESGIMFDFKRQSWPVSIAIDLLGANEDAAASSTFNDGGTGELHLGVRKYWNFGNSPIHPYAGGGLAVIGGALEKKNNVEEEESAVGAWVGAGVMWTIADKFNIGADVRYSKADVTLFNQEREAGGLHTNLMLGVSW